MLLNKTLLCQTAPNSVRRLLEQQKDGSLLYSRWNHSTNCEEIRLFNAASSSDKQIFINYTGLEIVNASLNPSADVIAFTTFCPNKASRDIVLPSLESVSSGNDSDGDNINSVHDQSDSTAVSRETPSWRTFDDDGTNDIETVEPFSPLKGRYVTHLADVHPVSWMKKFDVSRSMYQKVIFTNCDVTKKDGKTSYRENRLLLIMNRKWVGLYSIMFEPKHISRETSVDVQLQKWRMLSPPKSLVIARKPVWVQWNAACQRLYFVTVSKGRKTKEETISRYSTSLSCEQLVQSDVWSRKIFSIKIDLNLQLETIRERPPTYVLRDMDCTVSSSGINMRLLELYDGGLCLAWQTLSCADEQEKSLYKIALIDKNILITTFTKTSAALDRLDNETKWSPLSFSSFGNNVVIKGNAESPFLHCIAMDCISYETPCLSYPCHYMSPKCQFANLGEFIQLPFSIVCEDSPRTNDCDSFIVYDASRITVHCLSADPQLARDIYFDHNVSLVNRLAVTRFGRLAFTAIKDDFRNILLHFASNEMILVGEQFLGTLLIHYVTEELCAEFSDIAFLNRLLPFGIPSIEEDGNFFARCEHSFTEDDIVSQVLQAIDERAETKSLWRRTSVGLKSRMYEPYDFATVSDYYDMLISTREDETMAKDNLRRRLEDVYEHEISKHFQNRRKSVFFAQSLEDDRLRKCLMALTYEGLSGHLQRFIENDGLIKRIAINYAITQQSAVDHYMNLFTFLNIDDAKVQSLFDPITGSEWKLLKLLQKLLDTCVTINFPFPAGIQTYLACLYFRHCVAIYQTQNKNDPGPTNDDPFDASDTELFRGIDIPGLSFEFLQLIDVKCVQVTSEFVAKLLEDVPDHVAFGSLIQGVLSRTKFTSDKILDCMLQQWNHPDAKFRSARDTMTVGDSRFFFTDYLLLDGEFILVLWIAGLMSVHEILFRIGPIVT